jgi:hypothetical protein
MKKINVLEEGNKVIVDVEISLRAYAREKKRIITEKDVIKYLSENHAHLKIKKLLESEKKSAVNFLGPENAKNRWVFEIESPKAKIVKKDTNHKKSYNKKLRKEA